LTPELEKPEHIEVVSEPIRFLNCVVALVQHSSQPDKKFVIGASDDAENIYWSITEYSETVESDLWHHPLLTWYRNYPNPTYPDFEDNIISSPEQKLKNDLTKAIFGEGHHVIPIVVEDDGYGLGDDEDNDLDVLFRLGDPDVEEYLDQNPRPVRDCLGCVLKFLEEHQV